jgi:hypothetical protein
MPEIAPSPDYGRSIDRPFNERAMVLQAWGAYGTIWPVVHQQLGVRPDLGNGRLEVMPQVPPQSPGLSGKNILLGDSSVDVSASAGGNVYKTVVFARTTARVTVGHTVPNGKEITSVSLNEKSTPYKVRMTNRGQEILVNGQSGSEQRLVVTTE